MSRTFNNARHSSLVSVRHETISNVLHFALHSIIIVTKNPKVIWEDAAEILVIIIMTAKHKIKSLVKR